MVGSTLRADRVIIRFKSPHPLPGTYAETWRIRTTDLEIPEIAFPVSARVADGFSVTPHVLTIDVDSVGAAPRADHSPRMVSRTVTLRRDCRKPFKILSVETKPRKWGDVRIVPRPLNGWAVVVENIDPASVCQFSKKPFLKIETDLPEAGALNIPLRVVQ